MKISGYYSQNHTFNPLYNGYSIGGSVSASDAFTGVQPENTTSRTVRVNYDQTLRPTLLLHFGAGYIHTFYPYETTNSSLLPSSSLGFYNNNAPNITGISGASGGSSIPIGSGASFGNEYEEKITGNTSLTWVKGNHNFKFGGELGLDGLITQSTYHANGILNFSAQRDFRYLAGISALRSLEHQRIWLRQFPLGPSRQLRGCAGRCYPVG